MQIRQLRIKAGLSQKELAERLKVAQPSVHSWENGDADPKTDKLPALAAALGCTIDDLFADAVHPQEPEQPAAQSAGET